MDLAVGDDGADDHLLLFSTGNNGGLAENNLNLPGPTAALRDGLNIRRRGPSKRAPVLEILRRAEARDALGGALRRRAVAVEIDGASKRRALAAGGGVGGDHGGDVEAVDEADAVSGLVEVAAVVDGELDHGGRRRGAGPAAGGGGVAAGARRDAAGPEGGWEREGEQRVGVEARRVVGDGREAGVWGD